jgi:Spy/CpxP family protein refolding chaperone
MEPATKENGSMLRFALTACLLATPAAAQHRHGSPAQHSPQGAAPYAGFKSREAAGISAEEAADLRAGRGMAMALPAELNGHPGPMHALELAEALGLTATQRNRLEGQMAAMRAEAIPLGEALIAAERALDAVFARGAADAAAVEAASHAAAVARGRLRAAHLRTHLATREVLTEAQRADYARLRGYAAR